MSNTLEVRPCFKQEEHAPHEWGNDIGLWCMGHGLTEDGYAKTGPEPTVNDMGYAEEYCGASGNHPVHIHNLHHFLLWCDGDFDAYYADEPEYVTAPEDAPPTQRAILDARSAYGDKVQNQVEQAAMINAYLSGREVRPVDVPMIFILVKCHRLGKMPDYKDSYDDIEGYLDIAKLVIGGDMIEATTAKEYMAEKERRQLEKDTPKVREGLKIQSPIFDVPVPTPFASDQEAGELIEKWRAANPKVVEAWRKLDEKPSGNPYANVKPELEVKDKRCWIVSPHHEHHWDVKGVGHYHCDGHGA